MFEGVLAGLGVVGRGEEFLVLLLFVLGEGVGWSFGLYWVRGVVGVRE